MMCANGSKILERLVLTLPASRFLEKALEEAFGQIEVGHNEKNLRRPRFFLIPVKYCGI